MPQALPEPIGLRAPLVWPRQELQCRDRAFNRTVTVGERQRRVPRGGLARHHRPPAGERPELASPQEVVVHTAKRTSFTGTWYGGSTRDVEVITGTGHWYCIGEELVAVRWVYVHDCTGTHRNNYGSAPRSSSMRYVKIAASAKNRCYGVWYPRLLRKRSWLYQSRNCGTSAFRSSEVVTS